VKKGEEYHQENGMLTEPPEIMEILLTERKKWRIKEKEREREKEDEEKEESEKKTICV
jgi:hypothetical protein